MLYSDKDGIDFAYERLVQDKKSSRASIPIKNGNERDISPPSRSNPPDRRDSGSRIAHNMALRFKNRDKFTGKLGKDLTEHINNYIDASQDYCLDQGNKFVFFQNIFEGEAKRFYREKVQERCGNFGQACQIMQDEYKNITRQNRFRKYLQSLRIQSLMNMKKLNTTEALEEFREIITRLAPQGPRTHRSEEDTVEYLYKAVVGAPWATSALANSQSTVNPWDFQQLYTALDAAWLQDQEEQEGRKKEMNLGQSILHKDIKSTSKYTPDLYYEGQRYYGRPRKPGSRSSALFQPHQESTKAGQNGLDRFGNPRLCNNCRDRNHFIRDCPKPRNVMKNATPQFRKYPQTGHEILFELCQQLEDALFSTDEENRSAAIAGENFKQEDSGLSEEETHQHPDARRPIFHVTGSENQGIASVLDLEDF